MAHIPNKFQGRNYQSLVDQRSMILNLTCHELSRTSLKSHSINSAHRLLNSRLSSNQQVQQDISLENHAWVIIGCFCVLPEAGYELSLNKFMARSRWPGRLKITVSFPIQNIRQPSRWRWFDTHVRLSSSGNMGESLNFRLTLITIDYISQ